MTLIEIGGWATHDFPTHGERQALCRHGRSRVLGRTALVRHIGAVLAMEACRKA